MITLTEKKKLAVHKDSEEIKVHILNHLFNRKCHQPFELEGSEFQFDILHLVI